jgi:hypothetical protein
MSATAAYLGSFQPVTPMLAGFNLALSTEAADLLSQLPAQNAAMELALARQALSEVGATRRQKMALDVQKRELEAARRANALRMAGSLFGMGGSVGAGLGGADPLQLKSGLDALLAQRRANLAGRGVRSNAYLAQAVENLG